MHMQHATMIWRQLSWHFRAFKKQNWIVFSCLRPESMRLLCRWPFLHGSVKVFLQDRARGCPGAHLEASPSPTKSAPAVTPHPDRVFGCAQFLTSRKRVYKRPTRPGFGWRRIACSRASISSIRITFSASLLPRSLYSLLCFNSHPHSFAFSAC
jgi:hypothetical protein